MPSKYFQVGAERAGKVADLFAQIAPTYDLINDLQSLGLHRLWKRRLLKLAAVRPGERVLDACCGTGDLTLGLARSGGLVTGFDFSEPMLAVARKRAQRKRLPACGTLEFQQGDVMNLPFPSGAFNLVTIGYGLRNLADFDLGMTELTRVLAAGGRFLALEFGKPDNQLWRRLYFTYLRFGVPLFGRLFCGDSETHAYVLDSLLAYPAQRGVDAWLRSNGFADPAIIHLAGGAMSINFARKA